MSKKAASIFVIAATVLLSAFDVYLALDDIPGNTYSERIRVWGHSYRWLPFLIAAFMGALLTHWFAKPYRPDNSMPSGTEQRPWKHRIIIWLALVFTVAVGGALGLWW